MMTPASRALKARTSLKTLFPTGLLLAVLPALVSTEQFSSDSESWPGTFLPLMPDAGLRPLKWGKTNRPSQWLGRFDIKSDLLLRLTG